MNSMAWKVIGHNKVLKESLKYNMKCEPLNFEILHRQEMLE